MHILYLIVTKKIPVYGKMKVSILLLIVLSLISFYIQAEGQKDINGWNVRWSDPDEYGVFARIRKSENVDDHDRMELIIMDISQDIDNLVQVGAIFKKTYSGNNCEKSKEWRDVTGKINSQPVSMKLRISKTADCDTFYSWTPISEEGKNFLRHAFNSGVVRFSYGSFDHIYDTRGSLPAYKAMKEAVALEERAAKNAL